MHSRDDVITLQNPHGLPPISVSKPTEKATEVEKKAVVKPAPAAQVTGKAKNVPCKLTRLSESVRHVLTKPRECVAVFHGSYRSIPHFYLCGATDV